MNRLFDIFFSVLGLVISTPFFIVVSVLIKADSPGPVFFLQERVGKGGKSFRLVKFRSMRRNGQTGESLLTVGEDARITRIGRFLRKYKLDELPQLYNVLVGDMSMVGPRPEVKKYVDCYTEEQRRVLSVRPGITDMASIAYKNENEILKLQADPERYYIEHIMPEKIRLNQIFLSNPGPANYFRIIFLTVKSVFMS